MQKNTILVVDDEDSMRKNISDLLSIEGYNITEAADGETAIESVLINQPDAVLLDIGLPQKDGFTVLKELKNRYPELPIIIFTAYGTSERAIEAMKLGAFDYLEKPFELDEFLIIVKRAVEYKNLLVEVKQLRSKISETNIPGKDDHIISKSAKMQEIFKIIGKVSPTDATVIIQGDSGTGKEIVADAIHRHSLRRDKPYVKINCGAFSESILESEIFGHEKGSFTGATTQRQGRFEIADGGTILLDEIDSMPPSLQVRLLRVLQQQVFFRVGGEKPIKTDVRILAATNKNIEKEVSEGRFREDLFYRLNVVKIIIPKLKERPDDISVLVEHFIQKYSPNQKIIIPFETMQALQEFNWPGNIRQLENTIQRAIVMSRDNILFIDNLPLQTTEKSFGVSLEKQLNKGYSFKEIIVSVEKELILKALKKFNYNRTKAAEHLQIHRRLLYSKINEYEIDIK